MKREASSIEELAFDRVEDGVLNFETVVCGVDYSPQSTEATRQAAVLAADGARLFAVSAWDPGLAVHSGADASTMLDALRDESFAALREAKKTVPAIEQLPMKGAPVACLLAAVSNLSADLVCVGAHGRSRAAGILFGSVASAMAHHAPCSVLVARASEGRLPDRILHAGDGSAESQEAARVAGRIASRHGGSVTTLHVSDDGADPDGLAEEAVELMDATGVEPVRLVAQGSPHRKIVETANSIRASLVVVGSRGLTGVKALGSVSERSAHHAPCSVLIVRRSAHPQDDDVA